MSEDIKAQFTAETELLGLRLLPEQQGSLLAAYVTLRQSVKTIGADYPFEAEPAHVFLPPGEDRS